VIDEGLGQIWPELVRAAVKPFLQGHLIAEPPLFYGADLRHPVWSPTRLSADTIAQADRGEDFIDLAPEDRPSYGIITTQSCDLAEERPNPQQPWLSVAPVYAVKAKSQILNRDYIFELAPPDIEDELWIADLRIEIPLEKSVLVGRTPIEAFPTESGYIAFANFLARRRGRPALASVFHEILSTTTKQLKDEHSSQRRLARQARENVYKLMLAIEDGTRLSPMAAKLYVITDGSPSNDTRAWFDLWWNKAGIVAKERGLQLHPTGWLNSQSTDLRRLEDLVEMRSPL
jgi:hypothetical protein